MWQECSPQPCVVCSVFAARERAGKLRWACAGREHAVERTEHYLGERKLPTPLLRLLIIHKTFRAVSEHYGSNTMTIFIVLISIEEINQPTIFF